ncbi:MAG: hypothetical protein ACK5RG_14730, partial [Cyclobacteriaceae bacterium]
YPALIRLLSNKHPQSYLGTPTIQRKKPFLNCIQRFSLVAQKTEELRKKAFFHKLCQICGV